ncbi:MAG: hypothetical protein AAF702_27590 [Chloroflexota bacterium]
MQDHPNILVYGYLNDFGIRTEQKILDIGGRHAKQAIEIVRRYGCKVELIAPILSHIERAKANVLAASLTGSKAYTLR